MLQQTTVKAVLPRYAAFLRRWPDVEGAGRAPSLARCSPPGPGLAITPARAISMLAPAPWPTSMAASFRADEAELRKLPGIGDYTAAAIAAIAFGQRGDAGRRQYRARGGAPVRRHRRRCPKPSRRSRRSPRALTRRAAPAISRKAMMDLGATICTPRRPACGLCPVGPIAAAMPTGSPRRCPIARRRASGRCAAASPSSRFARTAPCCCASGRCAGCSGGMLETPSSPWEEAGAERKVSARPRAAQGRLAEIAGPGRAHLHAFSSGA